MELLFIFFFVALVVFVSSESVVNDVVIYGLCKIYQNLTDPNLPRDLYLETYLLTMPRKYKRKTLRAAGYSKLELEEAIQKVRNGELTNYAAAKQYNIPTSTLNDRVRNKTGVVSQSLGRPTALPLEAEERLADYLRVLEKWGFGLSKAEVMNLVSEYIKANKIKISLKNDIPGDDWFVNFRRRHRLSIKKPQPVEYLRKRMTDPFVIDQYFDLLNDTLKELNINDPRQIWNLDETSVCLDPSRTKVVGSINQPCTRTTSGPGKENITVLTTANAAGKSMDPLIIFKGKHMYKEWMAENKYDFEISYAVSKRGWMESDILYNYMEKVVIPSVAENKPALIIYDGHSTHVDQRVVELARQNQLTILKLPAHTSHLLQPLDLAVFKSFKTMWDAELVKWQRQNIGAKIRKQAFADMFARVWSQTKPQIIQNGFKKAGIHPFDRNIVPQKTYDPNVDKRFVQSKRKNPKTLNELSLNALNDHMNIVSTASQSKIKILSNVLVRESFENLLLQKIKRSEIDSRKIKLTRAAKGGEVITRKLVEIQLNQNENTDIQNAKPTNPSKIKVNSEAKDAVQQNENEEIQKANQPYQSTKKRKISKVEGKKVIINSVTKNENEEPQIVIQTNPSSKKRKLSKVKDKKVMNTQNETKITATKQRRLQTTLKRNKEIDSETSVSDTMSLHSDSDIENYFLEHMTDGNDFDEITVSKTRCNEELQLNEVTGMLEPIPDQNMNKANSLYSVMTMY